MLDPGPNEGSTTPAKGAAPPRPKWPLITLTLTGSIAGQVGVAYCAAKDLRPEWAVASGAAAFGFAYCTACTQRNNRWAALAHTMIQSVWLYAAFSGRSVLMLAFFTLEQAALWIEHRRSETKLGPFRLSTVAGLTALVFAGLLVAMATATLLLR